jgi:hypothetical protein
VYQSTAFRLLRGMNLVLTVVVIAGTYMLACLLLSALGRIGENAGPASRASRKLPVGSTSCD